jgi:hypothetical protein
MNISIQTQITRPAFNFNKATMSIHVTQLLEHQLFSILRSQTTSLAIPLYGTRSEDASKVYDVVSYSMSNDTATSNNNNYYYSTHNGNDIGEEPQTNFGVAIILYTGPPASPFISWTLISHVDNQPDIVTGANRLLADLRKGMGGVMGMFSLPCTSSRLFASGISRIMGDS